MYTTRHWYIKAKDTSLRGRTGLSRLYFPLRHLTWTQKMKSPRYRLGQQHPPLPAQSLHSLTLASPSLLPLGARRGLNTCPDALPRRCRWGRDKGSPASLLLTAPARHNTGRPTLPPAPMLAPWGGRSPAPPRPAPSLLTPCLCFQWSFTPLLLDISLKDLHFEDQRLRVHIRTQTRGNDYCPAETRPGKRL